MNKLELKKKLDSFEISSNQYSLDGELKPDAIILYKNYNDWNVFYLDERGGKNDEKTFQTENEACLYIYNLFKDSRETANKYGINN